MKIHENSPFFLRLPTSQRWTSTLEWVLCPLSNSCFVCKVDFDSCVQSVSPVISTCFQIVLAFFCSVPDCPPTRSGSNCQDECSFRSTESPISSRGTKLDHDLIVKQLHLVRIDLPSIPCMQSLWPVDVFPASLSSIFTVLVAKIHYNHQNKSKL